jgi:transcriptional regulator with XRE-family HTH domain
MEMFKCARKQIGMTISEAAFQTHIGERTLANYESGQRIPPPDVVLAMSKVYNQPELTQCYCRNYCAIGATYSYDNLNGVDMHPLAVLDKMEEELLEAVQAVKECRRLFLNKRSQEDFSDAEWGEVIENSLEFLDAQHVIDVFKVVIERYTPENTFVAGLTARHNDKCKVKGYARKEERPLVTAAR